MTATWIDPPVTAVRDVVSRALAEDLGVFGDVTGRLVPPAAVVAAVLVARAPGVLAGRLAAAETFAAVDPAIVVRWAAADGDSIDAGRVLAEVEGPLASVLTAERTALNLLGHLSGVATLTRRFVDAAGPDDPDPRHPQDHPRLAGPGEGGRAGRRRGTNHRGSLSEGILLKDNHLAGISIEAAVALAQRPLAQPGRRGGVRHPRPGEGGRRGRRRPGAAWTTWARPRWPRPSSSSTVAFRSRSPGGSRWTTVAALAAAGADLISVGALTHSAPVLDIGLDLEP